MRGYEALTVRMVDNPRTLRIPMRGYEVDHALLIYPARTVTNPHAGL